MEDCKTKKRDERKKRKKGSKPNNHIDSFGYVQSFFNSSLPTQKLLNKFNDLKKNDLCIPPHSSELMCKTDNKSGSVDLDLWYIDSGATQHATNDRSTLVDIKTQTEIMSDANGSKINIKDQGYVPIHTDQNENITLPKCFYSPDLVPSFLSVSRLSGMDYTTTFNETNVLIYKNVILIAEGIRIQDMYAIKGRTTLDRIAGLQHAPSNSLSPEQLLMSWYRTLGYTNFDDIKRMEDRLKLKSTTAKLRCETCGVAKCTRLPFGEAEDKSKQMLDIIH